MRSIWVMILRHHIGHGIYIIGCIDNGGSRTCRGHETSKTLKPLLVSTSTLLLTSIEHFTRVIFFKYSLHSTQHGKCCRSRWLCMRPGSIPEPRASLRNVTLLLFYLSLGSWRAFRYIHQYQTREPPMDPRRRPHGGETLHVCDAHLLSVMLLSNHHGLRFIAGGDWHCGCFNR